MMDTHRNYILARSCKFEQKKKKNNPVNLRIAVPPLTDRGSSINSEELCEEYRLTYLFVCHLIILL